MALSRSNSQSLLTVEEVGDLLVLPVISAGIATSTATVLITNQSSFRIPLVTADPAASWVAEGSEISPSDATLSETDVVFNKVAGLSIVSRELAEDTDPAALAVVGEGLARDIARKIDAAYFANTTANGPAGLGSLTTSVVTSGSAFTVDAFIDAVAAASDLGATIDHFVVSSADYVSLSKIKELTAGSNKPLLEPDPTRPSGRLLLGVPLVLAPGLLSGTAWAIPASRCFVVIRDDATVETDASVYFTSDRVAVKATMRLGFGFAHPLAIVKVTHT
jgi:HK97 family phage major capsid protein